MTSPLPPRLRDTRSIVDRLRQDRQNLRQLGVGFVGGRFPPARPLGATAAVGDFESDEDFEDGTEQIQFENTDRHVAGGPGIVKMTLSHVPIEGSLHVRWNGLDLDPVADWTLFSTTVTIPDPSEHVRGGDIFTAAYAYYPGDTVFDAVEWGSTGPYLVVAEDDLTDYSAPGFDDAGWSLSAAPLGFPVGSKHPGYPVEWLAAVTSTGATNTGVWLRRTVTIPEDGFRVTISARADGQYWLYLDGSLVDSYTGDTPEAFDVGPFEFVLAAGDHTIALHVNDDTPDPGDDYFYADVEIQAVPG